MAGDEEFENVADAARLQYTVSVADMLASGEDVNAKDKDGNTALHWSCLLGLDSLTSLLLAHDARTDLSNDKGDTPAHCAARSRNSAALKMLCAVAGGVANLVLSARNVAGKTPFLDCAEHNDASLMEWMYLRGVCVDERDANGGTALQLASRLGHTRTVQWLLSRSASVGVRDDSGLTALHWASGCGEQEVAKMLLDAGAAHLVTSPDRRGGTPTSLAWRNGHMSLLFWLLRARLVLAWQSLTGSSLRRSREGRVSQGAMTRSVWSYLFGILILQNLLVFAYILAPTMWHDHSKLVTSWLIVMFTSIALWLYAMSSNPGWSCPRTVWDQSLRVLAQEEDFKILLDLAKKPLKDQVEALMSPGIFPSLEILSEGSFIPLPSPRGGSAVARGVRRANTDDSIFEDSFGGDYNHHWGELERRQAHLASQHQLLNFLSKASGFGQRRTSVRGQNTLDIDRPLLEESGMASLLPEDRANVEAKITRSWELLPGLVRKAADEVSPIRIQELRGLDGTRYLDYVEAGDFRHICVICHNIRRMRSFHCKQCGRCVQRLDHHCPWIDRCVGIGNQRLFYVFLVMLFSAIAMLFVMAAKFLSQDLDNHHLFRKVRDLLVLPTLCVDGLCGLFVGGLIIRQTAYMLVNVTTYEVLVCPPHVQHRFPRRQHWLWFLSDLSISRAYRNVLSYWRLDMSQDSLDFSEGFETGSEDEMVLFEEDDLDEIWCSQSVREGVPYEREDSYSLGFDQDRFLYPEPSLSVGSQGGGYGGGGYGCLQVDGEMVAKGTSACQNTQHSSYSREIIVQSLYSDYKQGL